MQCVFAVLSASTVQFRLSGYPQAMPLTHDQQMMQYAIEQARLSREDSGIPIGAVLVDGSGAVVGRGHNERIQRHDATAHGEISCLRNAGRRQSYRDCTLYTTLAPCAMCSGAILLFSIPRVVVGEAKTFQGEVRLLESRGVDVVNLNERVCVELMQEFIRHHPTVWSEDIGAS